MSDWRLRAAFRAPSKVEGILVLILFGVIASIASAQPRQIPRTWDEKALLNWATPVAGLNVRPHHLSEKEYYATPADNLRTYPVYFPDREPAGYWEKLQKLGPQPLIEPAKLKTEADWTAAGKRVFDELDAPTTRHWDRETIALFRSKAALDAAPTEVLPDGTIAGSRWVPTSRGIAISVQNCGSCHTRQLPGGKAIPGPPNNVGGTALGVRLLHMASSPIPLPGDTPGMELYRVYGVPWVKDDVHERFKKMENADIGQLLASAFVMGVIPRWGGSPYNMSKVPDLIGLKERKYFDHTASHLHRNIGDLMRYAALVSFAEATTFGPHEMLAPTQPKIYVRVPDEALYALALYIYSLEPPVNPNAFDVHSEEGREDLHARGMRRLPYSSAVHKQ